MASKVIERTHPDWESFQIARKNGWTFIPHRDLRKKRRGGLWAVNNGIMIDGEAWIQWRQRRWPRFMKKIFDETRLSLAKDLYITYLVKCTPRKQQKKQQPLSEETIKPLKRHINNCILFLTKEISIITPHIIVSLGLDVSNIILHRFFSVEKKYDDIEKIHMRIFENPSFKLVPFFDPCDVIIKGNITKERYMKDFSSLAELLKMV